jgi:hypothetical protein
MMNRVLIAVALLAVSTGAAHAQGMDISIIDANGDGAITRAEARAARAAMFERLDINQDGRVTRAERDAVAQQIAARGAGRMDRADANNDGAISEAEFMNQPYRGFDFLDRNHDGVLSAAETADLRARLARQ